MGFIHFFSPQLVLYGTNNSSLKLVHCARKPSHWASMLKTRVLELARLNWLQLLLMNINNEQLIELLLLLKCQNVCCEKGLSSKDYSIYVCIASVKVLYFSIRLIFALSFLSVHVSSFQSSVLGRRADPSGVFPETEGSGMVSAKRSSWRKCSRATRRVSEATSRRPFICTLTPCKPTHRTASCTVTVQRRFSNWDSTRRRWTMLKKLVSSIPSGPR